MENREEISIVSQQYGRNKKKGHTKKIRLGKNIYLSPFFNPALSDI